MPGDVKGITIEFRGDTTKLSKAINQMRNEAKTLDRELGYVDKALKFNPTSVKLWTQKQKVLNEEINKTDSRLNELKAAQKELDGKQVDNNSAEYRELEREIIKCESKLKDYKKELRTIPTAKLKALSEGFKKVGGQLKDAGAKMTKTVTAPLMGIGAIASKIGIDFDSEMAKVAAISGATGESFDALREKAREMGRETKFSAEEAAEGFEYMAMAGWKPDQMLAGIEPILKLATAAGEELSTTSDIVTDALTAFGLQAEDAGHFVDVLAAASSNANTNVSMLGESFKYAAPVAGALGFDVEDVAVALGLMANSGIKASQGGTALRTLFTNLANPTEQVANAMDTLGVSLDDGAGNMKSFREIMLDLRNGFNDMKISQEDFTKQMNELDEALSNGEISEKQYNKAVDGLMQSAYGAEGALKAQAAAQLAGKQGMSGLLAIVNSSDEDFNKLTEAIDNCEGATDQMAETMMNNAGGAIIEMKSALSDAAIAIADVLAPWIRKAAEFVSKLANKFSELDPTIQRVIVVVGAIAAAIGPLLAVVGTIISSIGTVIGALGKIAPILTGLKAVVGAIGAPWLIGIGLIIAAVVLLVKNWDWVKEKANQLKDWVVGKWRALKDGVVNFVKQLKDGVIQLWNGLKEGVKNIAISLTIWTLQKFNAFKEGIRAVFTAIKSITATIWQGIKEKITSPIKTAWEFIKSIIAKIKNAFEGLKIKLPDLKLPHFSIQPPGWKISDLLKGDIPKLGIDWYKEGGIFTKPTLLNGGNGVGEAGAEAVLPLKKLWDEMDKRFSNGGIVINVYGAPGMDTRELAQEVKRELVTEIKRNKLAWG